MKKIYMNKNLKEIERLIEECSLSKAVFEMYKIANKMQEEKNELAEEVFNCLLDNTKAGENLQESIVNRELTITNHGDIINEEDINYGAYYSYEICKNEITIYKIDLKVVKSTFEQLNDIINI